MHQTKIGIRPSVIPGQRRQTIVTRMFTAVAMEAMPPSMSESVQ